MDLEKFYPENLSKLTYNDLKEFKSLTVENITELAKKETSFKPNLVYINKSSKHNPFPTSGNYTSVLKFLKEGNNIELVSPRLMFMPQTVIGGSKMGSTPIETVTVEAMSLSDFAAKKEADFAPSIEGTPISNTPSEPINFKKEKKVKKGSKQIK